MRQIERGVYGHINAEKKKLVLGAVFMVVLALAVFFLGLLLNRGEKRNIFSVAAVLFVLPWARYISTLAVLLPYRTMPKERQEKIAGHFPQNAVVLSDYVFSSKERVMGLSFLVLTGHTLIGLTAGKKEKKEKIEEYLTDFLKRGGFSGKVIICDTEEDFLKAVKKASDAEKEKKELKELEEALRSLAI